MSNGKATIKEVYNIVNRLEEKMDKTFVTKDEFNPVRNIVYGATTLILSSVVIALLGLVMINKF